MTENLAAGPMKEGARPVPVLIVSGFLGSGKTTLLRNLLADPGSRKLGVLVNDFGALNIDADLVAEVQADVVALTNGCVCCSIRGDLVKAANRLLASGETPDYLIVETSGVSDPKQVAELFFASEFSGRLNVHGIFCLIDTVNFPELEYSASELAIDQAAVADIVLLNKCDLAPAETIEEVEETLREVLPRMRILRTVEAQVPADLLLDWHGEPQIRAAELAPARGQEGARHDAVFTSWSWQSERLLDLDSFRHAITQVPAGVFRLKGILHFADRNGEKAVLQMVGKRASIDFTPDRGPDPSSRLVAIGAAGEFEGVTLDRLFDACAAPGAGAPIRDERFRDRPQSGILSKIHDGGKT